jgi:ribosomal protein S18 acetylase RimI-like enzyme
VIRLMGQGDVEGMLAHVERLWSERETVRSRPFAHGTPFDRGPREERLRTQWPKPITEPGWMRTWGLIADGVIVGHVDLKGGGLASDLHRATLGIAIEDGHRDRGQGRAMCETAIAWARDNKLAWIDLGVFHPNKRAQALYRKLGFVEVGVMKDRFRLDGESIDDIVMTLAL